MDTADKIKFLRTQKLKMGQNIFAKKIDVTRKTIINWENGTSKPTVAHIMMISILCNVTTDYLIFDNHPLELSLKEIDDEEYILLKSIIEYFTKQNNISNL